MNEGWAEGSGSSRHGAVMLGRRGFLATAAAVTGGALAAAPVGAARAAAAAAEASTARGARLRLALPAPSGPYAVGTVALHLVDNSRQDPFLSAPRPRELMISLWYPASRQQLAGSRRWVVPWIPPAADTLLLAQLIPQPLVQVTLPGGGTGYEPGPPVSISLDGVSLPVTAARADIPAAPLPGGCPVLLYSPGEQVDREFGTTQAEDLASHGYIVASIDHTYEAPEVVFPGGRIAVQVNPQPSQTTVLTTRIADAQFVLDSLAALAGGTNPDAEHRPLPAGLADALDLPKTGMFGHSLGGDTAAQVMAVDDRVVAGLDLDGTIEPAVPFTPPQIDQLATDVAQKLDGRPFMFLCSAGVTPFKAPGKPEAAGIPGFWQGLSGWRLFLSMNDSAHFSYTDYEAFLSQLAAAGIITPSQASEVVTPYIGTIAPAQAIAAQRAYIGAFFDLQLRHHDSHLLDGPSGRYPEIEFVASAT